MSTPKIWDSTTSEWVPITDGQSSVPAAPQGTISAGQAMVYDGPGVWRPESVARQQDLDDLRDEFDGHYHRMPVAGIAFLSRRANTLTGSNRWYISQAGGPRLAATAGSIEGFFRISVSGEMRVRLHAWVYTETTPPTGTLDIRLTRMTALAGGAVTGVSDVGVGFTLTPTGANSIYTGSEDITLTTSGEYGVGFTHSATPTGVQVYGYRLEAL